MPDDSEVEQWKHIQDDALRKQIQNRLAQRRRRQKVKRQLQGHVEKRERGNDSHRSGTLETASSSADSLTSKNVTNQLPMVRMQNTRPENKGHPGLPSNPGAALLDAILADPAEWRRSSSAPNSTKVFTTSAQEENTRSSCLKDSQHTILPRLKITPLRLPSNVLFSAPTESHSIHGHRERHSIFST